jgi:hypothetical protein
VYYFTHRELWQPLASKLLPTIGLGLSVFASMFFFTYLPQAAVLAIFNGPLAAVSAALLVLSESSTIFNVMARALLVEDSLIDTFDGVSDPDPNRFQLTTDTPSRPCSPEVRPLSSPVTARSNLAATPSPDLVSWRPNRLPDSRPLPSSATSCTCL